MQIRICAIGAMKAGPERELVERYVERCRKVGRGLGVSAVEIWETPEDRAARARDRRAAETSKILDVIDPASSVIVLDEAGTPLSSSEIAKLLDRHRQNGTSEVVFVIGGPDGHDPSIRTRADRTWSFGAATFPHQIVRILVAEQIYRALTILARHPYHRG